MSYCSDEGPLVVGWLQLVYRCCVDRVSQSLHQNAHFDGE
jgi:hypothetical protein